MTRRRFPWKLAAISALIIVALGSLSGIAGGSNAESVWFRALEKPAWFPPPATFGIVWTLLYALIGVAFALVLDARGAPARGRAIVLFLLQLALNLAWTPVFFGLHQISWAVVLILAILIGAIAATLAFGRVRPLAAWLMLPYLAWLSFASVLALRFWQLNPAA